MAERLSRLLRVLFVALTLFMAGSLLVLTGIWNPLPRMTTWWHNFTRLANPSPAWDARVGGAVDLAAVLVSGQVVVVTRGFADGFDLGGQHLWHYQAYWALPATDVVVMRMRPADPDKNPEPHTGYAVVDPASGVVSWSDTDAIAVWAYSDRVLDLVCPSRSSCLVRARLHGDGTTLWTVSVPGLARTVLGPNPELAGTRDPAGWFATAAAGSPGRLPPVIGLVVDGKVQVIDTVQGAFVREVAAPDRATRVAFAADRVLFSHAEPSNNGCRFWVEAFDYRTGVSAWRAEGLDLDTASGAGCEQRDDPKGQADLLVALRGDNRPVLIAARTGETVWAGVPGEVILATDGELAVIAGADHGSVRVIDLLDPNKAVLWVGQTGAKPKAAVTRGYVLVWDPANGRLIVVSHVGVNILAEIKTRSDVAGYGDLGIVVASGRRFGLIRIT